jgi:lipopolysaccharide export system protein LptA
MKKSEAARYARWSAAAASVFAVLTVGVYLKRGWTRHLERKNAPAAAPVNVERQSSHLTFSKGEGTHKIFTVEASKSIDFKGLNASDLEGVKITIFGNDGARHDTMETHSCRYMKDTGDIACAGDVEIVLMSADQWNSSGGQPGAPGTMKVETKGVAFNRASGEAITDDQVRFFFANGTGEAVGAEYHSEEGTLRLQKNVKLRLDQSVTAKGKAAAGPKKEPVEISGTRMDFSRDEGTVLLSGPAEAKTQSQRLTAAAILVELDKNLHAKRLIAKSNGKESRPEFSAEKGSGKQRLSADEIIANFAPEGSVTRAEARGNVAGDSRQGDETRSVTASDAAMEMMAGQNAPKLLVLKGAVDARTNFPGNKSDVATASDARRLTTEELRLTFAEKRSGKTGAKGTKLASADTVGAGRIELSDAGTANTKASQTMVQADQLGMKFDGAGKASRFEANGNVRTERSSPGAEKQTATASNGFVQLQPQGGWSRIELSDEVKLNEGTRAAQADHADFARAEQTVTLSGRAVVKDANSLTSAKKLTLWQATGEIRGVGGVRSTDLSARSSVLHLAPVAANVSADQLHGNSKTGRALYTGHARLWQGDSVLEADSIELLKNERMMIAVGNVRAVFPQAKSKPNANAAANPSGSPVLWHAQSDRMTYWDRENRAKLERKALLQSPQEKITSDFLDLYFSRGNSAANPGGTETVQTAQAANGTMAGGAQQISRAVATGAVTVQQGERRATAERGEYMAQDGKFVMSGGAPTLFDASQGTTTGRQLTFFLADATIIVDSENGSRTVTKHRVEK